MRGIHFITKHVHSKLKYETGQTLYVDEFLDLIYFI